jgi:hypothetical protein
MQVGYDAIMAKPLQIREVPEPVHDALRRKAERAGLSLSAYALRVLERDARQPSMEDVLARIEQESGGRAPVRETLAALAAERAERE